MIEELQNKYASTMPRTMLRCSIERFPSEVRQKYLTKNQ